ncbi:MAG: gephyrin-like molybdotransferase Glp, partial [Actinomycetota bacterium]
MLSASDVQQRILERIAPLDALELSITDAHGCVLAETVTAPEDLPPHPSAATDGFAIRSADTGNAVSTPVSLTIIGEAAAGRPFAARVTHGEAVRISSGASLPDGTDAIVHRDDVAVVGSSMAIGKSIASNTGVRPAGEDVAKGDPVMQEGQRVRGMDVGVLAALGRSRALVRPRPRAVVISISDQLGDGGDGGPNAYAMAGMAREAGAEPARGGSVPADPDVLHEKFQSYLAQADVFITSGGTGEDEGSVIRRVAGKLEDIDLWNVSARPEMTIGFGRVQGRTFFALPDNAVAAAVAFELFVRPAILKVAGRRTLH